MKPTRCFLLLVLAMTARAEAVCLDPQSGISGYRVPLAEEVKSTNYVLLAKVSGVMARQDDKSDPTGVTEYIYSIQVRRWIKGKMPKNLLIRATNDSSRYPMEQGEVHLLFVSRMANGYSVDSCGNSSPLPEGIAMVNQVEAELGRRARRVKIHSE
jgi:hypothetical protein